MIKSVLVALSLLLMVGCGAKLPSIKAYKMEIQQGNLITSEMLLQLKPGMTKSQAQYVLGTPLIADSFHTNRWDYFYGLRRDGKVLEKRRIILDFEQDKLVSVRGDVVASSGGTKDISKKIAPKSVTPPKRKEKSLLAKLKFWDKDDTEQVTEAVDDAETKLGQISETETPQVDASLAVEAPITETSASKVEDAVEKVESATTEAVEPIAKVEPLEEQAETQALDTSKDMALAEGESQVVDAAKAEAFEVKPSTDMTAIAETESDGLVLPKVEMAAPTVAPLLDVDKQQVTAAVNDWAQAWRSKNFSQYLAAYSEDFQPEGFPTKRAWEVQRKSRIADRKGDIDLQLEDIQIDGHGGAASAQFVQKYRSDVYSDQVVKRLDMILDNQRWLIVKETVLDIAAMPNQQKVLAPEGSAEHLEGVIEKIGF